MAFEASQQAMPRRILFVCTGNICRSPMAEYLLASRAPKAAGYVIASAGTSGLGGHPADPLAVQLLQERGIDMRPHRAQGLTTALLSQADLILTMDAAQQRWVERRLGVARGSLFRLGYWQGIDIADPYGGTRRDFARALERIEACLEPWFPALFTSGDRARAG